MAIDDKSAPEEKLPEGYYRSTGSPVEVKNEAGEVVRSVTHPKGTIVGPQEAVHPEGITMKCPVCGQTIKSKSGVGSCAGENIQVVPASAKVIDGKIVFTSNDVYGVKQGDVFRTDVFDKNGQALWSRGSDKLVEGTTLEQNAVIVSRETHGKTQMEVV